MLAICEGDVAPPLEKPVTREEVDWIDAFLLDDLRDGASFFTGLGFAVTEGAVCEVKALMPLVCCSVAVNVFEEDVGPRV